MRRILATLAVVVALLFSAGAAWADYADGWAAYKRGDYVTALQEWRPLAERGHAEAQFLIGDMYANGEGVPENDALAVKWWRKAAEQGFAGAQLSLGGAYAQGEGVPEDYVKAHMWFSLFKAQGAPKFAETATKAALNWLKRKMTPEDISKAQELATEWWEEHNN